MSKPKSGSIISKAQESNILEHSACCYCELNVIDGKHIFQPSWLNILSTSHTNLAYDEIKKNALGFGSWVICGLVLAADKTGCVLESRKCKPLLACHWLMGRRPWIM